MLQVNKLEELITLCFLLNGRKRGNAMEGYNCGFFPHQVETRAHGKAGQPGIKIDFNSITFGYNWICVTFNNKHIYINKELTDFYTDDGRKNAQSIFGKNARASIIVTEAKWALCEILTEYRVQIEKALRGEFR